MNLMEWGPMQTAQLLPMSTLSRCEAEQPQAACCRTLLSEGVTNRRIHLWLCAGVTEHLCRG